MGPDVRNESERASADQPFFLSLIPRGLKIRARALSLPLSPLSLSTHLTLAWPERGKREREREKVPQARISETLFSDLPSAKRDTRLTVSKNKRGGSAPLLRGGSKPIYQPAWVKVCQPITSRLPPPPYTTRTRYPSNNIIKGFYHHVCPGQNTVNCKNGQHRLYAKFARPSSIDKGHFFLRSITPEKSVIK